MVDTAKRLLEKHKQKMTMPAFDTHLSDRTSSAEKLKLNF
ncbi:MAG: hypothetical protein Rpha_0990 [Candidatus Ruthia sp. Apha_13_S6]|nr:hypothetical protein [Candidatus Ruthia sp. Apha_13_S6]